MCRDKDPHKNSCISASSLFNDISMSRAREVVTNVEVNVFETIYGFF